MSLLSFGLVLSAAFIHVSWNLLAKKAAGGAPFVLLSSAASALLYAPAVIFSLIREPHALSVRSWALIAASAILHLCYSLSLQRGYQSADLSIVYPIARGTGPLVSTAGAMLVFGERPSPLALAGGAAVVAGVFLVAGGPRLVGSGVLGGQKRRATASRGRQSLRLRSSPFFFASSQHLSVPNTLSCYQSRQRWRLQSSRGARGVMYGAITGSFIAAYTILDGYAVRSAAIAPLLLDYFANLLRTILLAPVLLIDRRLLGEEWRRHWKLAAGVGVLSPLSYILVLIAIRTTPVSQVAPTREVSTLITALFGARLLREPHAAARLVGAALITSGVFALTLG